LYNIFIKAYPLLIQLAAFWNKKAFLWVDGRKKTWTLLQEKLQHNQRPVVWMHCSSLGEFEQGRPLFEAIQQQYPNYFLVLSFFSPSGFEVQKNYTVANAVVYLPMDSKANAAKWFSLLQPSLVLFVKYEFWYYYIQEANNRKIPMVLVSAIFRNNQLFFKWYGGFYRKILTRFSSLFLQNETSAKLLASIGITETVHTVGDTRFDRVLAIAKQGKQFLPIDKFIAGKITLVAGSTWLDDDLLLQQLLEQYPNLQLIVAPHNIDDANIKAVQNMYTSAVLYTDLLDNNNVVNNKRVIIVNTMGMLSHLYAYGMVCYIGGGFTKDGIHNIAEAAVYYKPIVIGPTYSKFAEAVQLVQAKAAFVINNATELKSVVEQLINNTELHKKTGQIAGNYIATHSGATEKIMDYIYAKRLLTN
jgi:3-deoxy-D-manno-octulosonic-acid transferase